MPTGIKAPVKSVSAASAAYKTELDSVEDLARLQDRLSGIARVMGFEYFALWQMPYVGYENTSFWIGTYPEDFMSEVYTRFRFGEDPMLDALGDADHPFLWEDLEAFKSPTKKQKPYLADLIERGYSRGYTVPVRIMGEPVGAVCFGTKDNLPVPREMLPFAEHVGTATYRKARAIVHGNREERRQEFGLTALEIQCIALFAQGKNDFIVQRLANLSEADFNAAIESVLKKLGVGNRITMVVKALQLGFISFNDALMG